MNILFLDDDPNRHAIFAEECGGPLVAVHSHSEAVRALNDRVFDIVFLDHDLHDFDDTCGGYGEPGRETTGHDTARFVAGLPPERRPQAVVVHSHNTVGACRMANTLGDAGIRVYVCPFRVGLWGIIHRAIGK